MRYNQQIAHPNRATANRTATIMSKSGFPGLVGKQPNKSPSRPKRVIESKAGNAEIKEVFNYKAENG